METKIYDITGTNGKAKNHIKGSINSLYSYNTKVAEYNEETKEIKVFGYFSVTTGRHLNNFFELFGLPKQTKKELFQNFNLKK